MFVRSSTPGVDSVHLDAHIYDSHATGHKQPFGPLTKENPAQARAGDEGSRADARPEFTALGGCLVRLYGSRTGPGYCRGRHII